MASSNIHKGEKIIVPPKSSSCSSAATKYKCERNNEYWTPLVLPVLHEEYRTSRCALCFNQLQLESVLSFDDSRPNPLYRLLFCSKSCLGIGTLNHLKQEELAVRRFLEQNKRTSRIFSTSILLYRILIREHDAITRNQVSQLQSTPYRETPDDNRKCNDESSDKVHTQAVIVTAMGMLKNIELSSANHRVSTSPSMEYLIQMVHRIKVNGFSICEEEFVAYGVGLYSTPSFMNHSCRPNVLQTFSFQQAKPPSLCLTAFQDIASDQEICISYTDCSCPSHMRRGRLERDYYFTCTCEACDKSVRNQEDAEIIGIRCSDCKSSRLIRVDEGINPTLSVFRCTECGKTDFENALQLIGMFESNNNKHGNSKAHTVKELNKIYQNLKEICSMDSWYVQEAGEQLLQEVLEELSLQSGNPIHEQQTAWKALKIAEELLDEPPSSGRTTKASLVSTSAFLKHQQLRYKAAKLRLFLIPDPRQSIQDLENVLSSLSPYYSKDHTLIVGLKECLANAMM